MAQIVLALRQVFSFPLTVDAVPPATQEIPHELADLTADTAGMTVALRYAVSHPDALLTIRCVEPQDGNEGSCCWMALLYHGNGNSVNVLHICVLFRKEHEELMNSLLGVVLDAAESQDIPCETCVLRHDMASIPGYAVMALFCGLMRGKLKARLRQLTVDDYRRFSAVIFELLTATIMHQPAAARRELFVDE
ncbi:MAG: hypothetical protein LBI39_02135 [Puniceicoccales bacterium]|jgi:hypothetical protein|nr:hypothetical protein [Puniceicoccales bacterium]